jgi:hypothetical protein
MRRLRLDDTGLTLTWVDLYGDMGDLIIICQQLFIMVGRFGKMSDDGDDGRQVVGAYAPYVQIGYAVV